MELEDRSLDINACWYAVRVRSRCEKLASGLLRGKGYQEFLPLYRARRRWSDRVQEVELPLFPGYTFCRFDARQRLPILTTPGVAGIVGFGGEPMPVATAEIAVIEAILRSGLAAQPWPYLKAGHAVRIEVGALSGLDGLLVEFKGRHRLVVSVTLLQRSVSVEIDRDWIVPVNRTAAARWRSVA